MRTGLFTPQPQQDAAQVRQGILTNGMTGNTPMHSELDELKNIAQAILNPEKEFIDLLPETQALRDLFERLTHFHTDSEGGIGAGQTRLESGLAISPTLAAMCIRELFRTPAFIRGLGDAIRESINPDRPVRVLYAGCGPYALLALPLMTLFSKGQVVFTLLDIHQDCLDDAMKLIGSFGFSDCVDECLCVDATTYRIPADKKPDVIVSETMSVALHNEPQVSIARNLLSQAPDAKMVPQQVSVEACMLNLAKEHVFMPADFVGEFPLPNRDRLYLGKIFELDADNIRRWEDIDGDRLPAGRVKIPSPLETRYRPYLLTKIIVYGDTCLLDYDCSLTIPRRLRGNIEAGDDLQFHYQLGSDPELRFEKAG